MDNTDTLNEAGLGFTARAPSAVRFRGEAAVRAERVRTHGALGRRLCGVFVVPDAPVVLLYHGEPVLIDGAYVGDVRVGSYGHTLGGAVGLAMISCPRTYTGAFTQAALLDARRCELVVASASDCRVVSRSSGSTTRRASAFACERQRE